MTLVQLVQLIGNLLTQLDQMLSDPRLPSSSPEWQQLYAMRVHLDNQQKQLVALSIQLDDESYGQITDKITAANTILKGQIGDFKKVASIASNIAQVASLVDKILTMAAL